MGSKDVLYGSKEHFKILAKKKGYASRAVFKLSEIDKKYNLIKKNYIVLDLGYWPGGWIEYCAKKAKLCVGVDIKEKIFDLDNIKVINIDVFDDKIFSMLNYRFNLVFSDMMSKTTGHKDVDSYNSYSLAKRALEIALKVLIKKGNFIVKVFESNDAQNLVKESKKFFETVKIFKPKSSRESSKEFYIICLKLKPFIQT